MVDDIALLYVDGTHPPPCLSGEIGKHKRLKIFRLQAYRFKSGLRHQRTNMTDLEILDLKLANISLRMELKNLKHKYKGRIEAENCSYFCEQPECAKALAEKTWAPNELSCM